MKKISNFFIISLLFLMISSINSKAVVFDTWIIEGSNPLQMAEATERFKEMAMSGGAKYLDIRASAKFRGDRPQDTSFIFGYYENVEDMLETQSLVNQNPDWFQSTYSEVDGTVMTSATFANNEDYVAAPVGATIAYQIVEIENFISFITNYPKLKMMMAKAGAPAALSSANCMICATEVLPGNTVIWMSAANSSDLGKAMDIFRSPEIQRWVYSNMRPILDIKDAGMHTIISK